MGLILSKNFFINLIVFLSLSNLNMPKATAWEPPKEESPENTQGETSRGCPNYLPQLSLIGVAQTDNINTSQEQPFVVLEVAQLRKPQKIKITITTKDNRTIIGQNQRIILTEGRLNYQLPELNRNQEYIIRASIPCQGSSLKGVRLKQNIIVSGSEKTPYDHWVQNYQKLSDNNFITISPFPSE